jgi:hypothetical protein
MTTPSAIRPSPDEFAAFYSGYVSQVPDGDVIDALEQGRRYAPGKWSIKGVLGHIADAERVFTYRALWFARGATDPLPGWDENAWAAESDFDAESLQDLLRNYEAVRDATLALVRGFPEQVWTRSGTANNKPVSVRGLIWVTAGHERHHLKILRERYLS